jgi:hypothetical protein
MGLIYLVSILVAVHELFLPEVGLIFVSNLTCKGVMLATCVWKTSDIFGEIPLRTDFTSLPLPFGSTHCAASNCGNVSGGIIMKRIYFLIPNIEVTNKVVDDLLLARVSESHIHVLAKRDTPMGNLPEASFLQKSDFIPALAQGTMVGGLVGIVFGLAAVLLLGSLKLNGVMVLVSALLGAGFGAWVASMVGSSIGNRRLAQFAQAIENGEFLMMVDVPSKRIESVEQMVKDHHPRAVYEGVEPAMTFP